MTPSLGNANDQTTCCRSADCILQTTPFTNAGADGQFVATPLTDRPVPAIEVLASTLTASVSRAQLATPAGQATPLTCPVSQPFEPLTDCEKSGALKVGGTGCGPGFGNRSGYSFEKMRPA